MVSLKFKLSLIIALVYIFVSQEVKLRQKSVNIFVWLHVKSYVNFTVTFRKIFINLMIRSYFQKIIRMRIVNQSKQEEASVSNILVFDIQ